MMRPYALGLISAAITVSIALAADAACDYEQCMGACRSHCQEGYKTADDLNACESGCGFACGSTCDQNQSTR